MSPEVRSSTARFLNQRGKKIQCYYWQPAERPRALLLICHGYTDHAMMYAKLAEEMAKRGFFVFAHDHAGHGKSEGKRAHVRAMNRLVDDAMYHIQETKKKFPDLPLFICGHSMGGSITILIALQKSVPINGVVILAPALLANPETASGSKLHFARVISRVIPQFPVAYADVTLATRNPEKVQMMNEDPLRHHGYFKARSCVCLLSSGEEILKKSHSLQVPYLLIHGDNDKVCHVDGSKKLHDGSTSKDKTLIVYPAAYHSLLQEVDEVASDVFNQIVQWLEKRA